MYDILLYHGKRNDYERVLGRRTCYFHIALAISMVSGGFIASYNIEWAILLSVIPLLLSALFALQLEEAPKAESTGEVHYLKHILLAFREVKSNRVLLYLIICLGGASVFGGLEEFDQLYYRLVGLPISVFGVVAFIWSLLNALGARAAYKLKNVACVLYVLPLASAVLLVLVWRYPSIPAIGLLLLAYAATTPVQILLESRLQHSIAGVSRATVTSVVALILNLPVQSLAFGLIGTVWNLPAIYLTSAIQLFFLSLWVFVMQRRIGIETAERDNYRQALT